MEENNTNPAIVEPSLLSDFVRILKSYIPHSAEHEFVFDWFYYAYIDVINIGIFGIVSGIIIITIMHVLYPLAEESTFEKLKGVSKLIKILLITTLISSIPVGGYFYYEANNTIAKITEAHKQKELLIDLEKKEIQIVKKVDNKDPEQVIVNKNNEIIKCNARQFDLIYTKYQTE